jgi:hypothetical protein
MEQSMQNKAQSVESMPNEFPALARPPSCLNKALARDRRVGERLDRLQRLTLESTRRRVAQIEAAIVDFDKMVNALDCAIQVEEDRTGIRDPAHFAYSISAMAMTQRRDNLKRSIAELKRGLPWPAEFQGPCRNELVNETTPHWADRWRQRRALSYP